MTTLRRKNSPNPGHGWFLKCSFLIEGEINHQVCKENLCYWVTRQDVGKGINPRNSKLARAAVRISELALVFLQEAVHCSVGSTGLDWEWVRLRDAVWNRGTCGRDNLQLSHVASAGREKHRPGQRGALLLPEPRDCSAAGLPWARDSALRAHPDRWHGSTAGRFSGLGFAA